MISAGDLCCMLYLLYLSSHLPVYLFTVYQIRVKMPKQTRNVIYPTVQLKKHVGPFRVGTLWRLWSNLLNSQNVTAKRTMVTDSVYLYNICAAFNLQISHLWLIYTECSLGFTFE